MSILSAKVYRKMSKCHNTKPSYFGQLALWSLAVSGMVLNCLCQVPAWLASFPHLQNLAQGRERAIFWVLNIAVLFVCALTEKGVKWRKNLQRAYREIFYLSFPTKKATLHLTISIGVVCVIAAALLFALDACAYYWV